MKPFFYDGNLSASKSLLNRALIVQSFFPQLIIEGKSLSDDVLSLEKSLLNMKNQDITFNCGSGGTTYRFLLARLSRTSGEYTITGSKRLFERPQSDLYSTLEQLGTTVTPVSDREVKVKASGWEKVRQISVSMEKSSQFVTAVLLSSWNLTNRIEFEISEEKSSQSYLEMTLSLLKQFGMKILKNGNSLIIPKQQTLKVDRYKVEPDMSSSFALGALALTKGELFLRNVNINSIQPDAQWTTLTKRLGGNVDFQPDGLRVSSSALSGGEINLSSTPDLFPVLAVLLSRAKGESVLTGLSVLKYKESDRLVKTCELLKKLGIETNATEDTVKVKGKVNHQYSEIFDFDPDQDHRLAMAATLAIHQGAAINILNRNVVNKSFPEFWEVTGL